MFNFSTLEVETDDGPRGAIVGTPTGVIDAAPTKLRTLVPSATQIWEHAVDGLPTSLFVLRGRGPKGARWGIDEDDGHGSAGRMARDLLESWLPNLTELFSRGLCIVIMSDLPVHAAATFHSEARTLAHNHADPERFLLKTGTFFSTMNLERVLSGAIVSNLPSYERNAARARDRFARTRAHSGLAS